MELPKTEVFETINLENLIQSFPEDERAHVMDEVLKHHKVVRVLDIAAMLIDPAGKITFEIVRAVVQRRLALKA